MVLFLIAISIASMMFSDWRAGKKEGPRPTRVKLVYGCLLLLVVYQTAALTNWIRLPDYYELFRALFKPAASGLHNWFTSGGGAA
ncbi:hypothetical protein [Paenibacillus humicola]|uniref:hypothetical protein n=1 Tax=Paenibacillus humicola TaxID=3110540 RepID=UPI00237A2823|nr:hypothetical protein [Paenibacillus humicola]